MLVLLATAGGFGGTFDAEPASYTLAPDAAPKLLLASLLFVLLVAWAWTRIRSLGS